jgi:hypothetical protein
MLNIWEKLFLVLYSVIVLSVVIGRMYVMYLVIKALLKYIGA